MEEKIKDRNPQEGTGKSKEFPDVSQLLTYENMLRHMPFVFFMTFLAVFYIWNTHHAVKTIKQIDAVAKDIKELRWTFMTAKSDLMFQSKQSEVAKRVEHLGLKELTTPPFKIVLKND